MDSNFRKLPSLILALVAQVSCETIVDIDIPVEKPSVVMNSLINPDSAWSVNLSSSEYVLNNDTTRFIENAVVNVFDENDLLVTTLGYDKRGYYRNSQSRPEAGKFYKIAAKVPGYNDVEGSTRVPAYPKIINATSRFTLFNFQPAGFYTVDFEDDPSTDNYYEIFMESVVEANGSLDSTAYNYFSLYIESDDPSVNTEILDFEVGIMFSDKLFSGRNIKLFLKTPEGGYGLGSWGVGSQVLVRSVSEDYYEYARTLKLQFKISSDPLAQPVEVRSNIKNGLGLVAGVAQSSFFISRPKPIINSIHPTSGKPGDIVIIEGENLSGNLANTQVWFFTNAQGVVSQAESRVPAGIVDQTATKLSVIVPTGASTSQILLSAFGSLSLSKETFIVIK
jgi:hypothetical protein